MKNLIVLVFILISLSLSAHASKIWMVGYERGYAYEFNSDGTQTTNYIDLIAKVNAAKTNYYNSYFRCRDITKGTNGNFYVIENTYDAVYEFLPDWTYLTNHIVKPQETNPSAAYEGTNGHWYVVGLDSNKVFEYSVSGTTWTLTNEYDISSISRPTGCPAMAQGRDGYWYIVNRSATVWKADSSFNLITNYNTRITNGPNVYGLDLYGICQDSSNRWHGCDILSDTTYIYSSNWIYTGISYTNIEYQTTNNSTMAGIYVEPYDVGTQFNSNAIHVVNRYVQKIGNGAYRLFRSENNFGPPSSNVNTNITLSLPKTANLVAKFDSTEIIQQADNTTLTNWIDTVNFISASQATDAARPKYRTNGVNNLPYVKFEGNQWLNLGIPATLRSAYDSQIYTTIIVYNNPASADPAYRCLFGNYQSIGTDTLNGVYYFADGSGSNPRVGKFSSGQLNMPTRNTNSLQVFAHTATLPYPMGSGTGLQRVYLNGGCISASTGPSTKWGVGSGAATGVEGAIGNTSNGANKSAVADMYAIYVWDVCLTPAEIIQFQKWAANKYAITLPWEEDGIYRIYDGDSITMGLGAGSAWQTYPYIAASNTASSYGTWANLGIGGLMWSEMGVKETEINEIIDQLGTNIEVRLSVFEWYNERYNSVASAITNARNYISSIKSNSNVKILLGTSTDNSDATGSTYANRRVEYNGWWETNAWTVLDTNKDAYVKIHTNLLIGIDDSCPASTPWGSYFNDGVHLTAAGYQVLGDIYSAVDNAMSTTQEVEIAWTKVYSADVTNTLVTNDFVSGAIGGSGSPNSVNNTFKSTNGYLAMLGKYANVVGELSVLITNTASTKVELDYDSTYNTNTVFARLALRQGARYINGYPSLYLEHSRDTTNDTMMRFSIVKSVSSGVNTTLQTTSFTAWTNTTPVSISINGVVTTTNQWGYVYDWSGTILSNGNPFWSFSFKDLPTSYDPSGVPAIDGTWATVTNIGIQGLVAGQNFNNNYMAGINISKYNIYRNSDIPTVIPVLKILGIGNSFTYYYNGVFDAALYDIAAYDNTPIESVQQTCSGARLYEHWNGQSRTNWSTGIDTTNIIKQQMFDMYVIQELSTNASSEGIISSEAWQTNYNIYASKLIEFIQSTNPTAQIKIYETWAGVGNITNTTSTNWNMQLGLTRLFTNLASHYSNVQVIPYGRAVQRATLQMASPPSTNLMVLSGDASEHPRVAGTYLMGAVTYSHIYDKTTEPFNYLKDSTTNTAINLTATPNLAQFLRRIAWDTHKNTISTNPPVIVSFNCPNTNIINVAIDMSVYATDNGTITNYIWSLGNGFTTNGTSLTNITYTFTATNYYDVNVTVQDNSGTWERWGKFIKVIP